VCICAPACCGSPPSCAAPCGGHLEIGKIYVRVNVRACLCVRDCASMQNSRIPSLPKIRK